MLTLNQILKKFEEIQTEHAQLNSFYFGDYASIGSGLTYPIMGCDLLPGNLEKGIVTTKFAIFFADMVVDDTWNKNDILSDMQLVALDVYAQIWEYFERNGIELSKDTPLGDFTERWDDSAFGWQMELTINQFYSRDTCQVPLKN